MIARTCDFQEYRSLASLHQTCHSRGKSQRISRQVAERFMALLPGIRRVASFCFRHVPRARREELIDDVVAKAYVAYAELVLQGRGELAYATPLARFAVRQIACGRQVGQRQNASEVLSPYAQRRRGFTVRPLVRQKTDCSWEELLVEDRRATPAEVAALRVDFRDWLAGLTGVQRQLALRLAAGETTSDAARRLGVSRPRVCQLRTALRSNWHIFQGEDLPA
jgi:hypothetical protein